MGHVDGLGAAVSCSLVANGRPGQAGAMEFRERASEHGGCFLLES
jgi:hypothetical protein